MINVLKLRGALINELPPNYYFKGSLDLTKSDIKVLPDNLLITEDLIIQDCLVDCIPAGAIVGHDLIYNGPEMISIHPTALICGNIIYNGNIMPNRFSENDNFFLLDDGSRFYYHTQQFFPHTSRDHRHNRIPYYVYSSFSERSHKAVTFETPTGTYRQRCKDIKEAKFLVNYQMAKDNGVEKYRGLDIDIPRSGQELLEIYATCVTFACDRGVNEFLEMFGLTLEDTLTIRELGYKVQEFKFFKYAPGVEVFLDFFNIPILEQYKRD